MQNRRASVVDVVKGRGRRKKKRRWQRRTMIRQNGIDLLPEKTKTERPFTIIQQLLNKRPLISQGERTHACTGCHFQSGRELHILDSYQLRHNPLHPTSIEIRVWILEEKLESRISRFKAINTIGEFLLLDVQLL
uniref:Uncharacterized protein n=1 Tax=Ascaris lumbricoides TaxID=6252 RepID=A0A0M3IEK5_ASCLU